MSMSSPTHLRLAGPNARRRAPRVVVIGAGLGGLAVALRLQGEGFDVVVLEQRDAPGGRASQLRTDGYTWDTGPSLITMPWVLEEAFAAGGLDLHSEVRMRRLDPLYRIRWASDDRHFDFHADADTAFVVGSADPHAHDLVLGQYSVHPSPATLRAGEQRLQEIQRRLQNDGRL